MISFALLRFALFFIASSALVTWAAAQNSPAKDCLPANQMKAVQLFGTWSVRFASPPAGLPATATMRLERHEEFSDSLAGVVLRVLPLAKGKAAAGAHADKAQLAGDLDGGLLLLDESSDNVSITGTWNGEMVEGSCGKIFRGVWKDTSAGAPANAPDIQFTLTKKP
jgi:hypothetical protein